MGSSLPATRSFYSAPNPRCNARRLAVDLRVQLGKRVTPARVGPALAFRGPAPCSLTFSRHPLSSQLRRDPVLLRLLRDLLPHSFPLGPELGPPRPLRGWKFAQRLRPADAVQAGVRRPALQRLSHHGAVRGRVAFQPSGEQGQISPQPFVGLLAPAGAFLLVEAGGVPATAATGQ